MKMYHCKLVNKSFVVEQFYREAESEKDCLETLQMFQFGKGKWVVEQA